MHKYALALIMALTFGFTATACDKKDDKKTDDKQTDDKKAEDDKKADDGKQEEKKEEGGW